MWPSRPSDPGVAESCGPVPGNQRRDTLVTCGNGGVLDSTPLPIARSLGVSLVSLPYNRWR
eukprot:765747-Hanusia_phi.AAC.1